LSSPLRPTASRADETSVSSDPACVILLHGLARTRRSMNTMAGALERAGYRTVNMDYPSRREKIENLAMRVIPDALAQCRALSCRTTHFVTHSMGGILLRHYLSRQPVDSLGRVVMISPPNQGSEVVDVLKDKWYFRWYNGPAGRQLGTGPDGIAARLGPVDFPLGVITGNVHAFFDSRWAQIIPGDDDGKVSVERAKIDGMADFLVVPYSHPWIMGQPEVIRQTLHFLSHGSFIHPQEWQTTESCK
jgi:triacylglycerol lipase